MQSVILIASLCGQFTVENKTDQTSRFTVENKIVAATAAATTASVSGSKFTVDNLVPVPPVPVQYMRRPPYRHNTSLPKGVDNAYRFALHILDSPQTAGLVDNDYVYAVVRDNDERAAWAMLNHLYSDLVNNEVDWNQAVPGARTLKEREDHAAKTLLPKTATATPEAAPTPYAEVVRVLSLLPKPAVGFVDFGCGSDARWCVAAAEQWKCRATGVEIDPDRAAAAREHVRRLGLDNLITIIEGDALTVDVKADVAAAYLYADVLEQLRPRLEKLTAFASYQHRPPGLDAVKSGDTWIYRKPAHVVAQQSTVATATWGGVQYAGRMCQNPGCPMCASIEKQLAQSTRPVQQSQPAKPAGHWKTVVQKQKYCVRGRCYYQDVEVQVWVAG